MFKKIKELTTLDIQIYGKDNIFHCLVEEVGEYSAARIIERGIKKKPLRESAKIEAVDVVIMALSIYFAEGGLISELAGTAEQKMKKWESHLINRD